MKKLSLYMMALLSMGFAACNDDFPTEFVPQTTIPESTFPVDAVSVTPTATSINLIDLLGQEEESAIELGTISLSTPLPENTELKAEVEISRDADFAQKATIEANIADNIISVMPSTLADAYYGSITKNPAATTLYLRTLLYTVTGGDAVAYVGKPGENFFATQGVAFTPDNRANISPAYYLVGGPNDWKTSATEKMIKFSHSGKDVYEDPVFTVIFDAAASGDTWFAIGDDAGCEAIGNDDWSKLLGIVGGNSQATEGQLDFRFNMGADNSFCVPAGAKKIKVTINMLEYTFKVEPVNISDTYYLIGGPGEWSADGALAMPFSHSSQNVFDDPVFTFVFNGNDGAGMWFAFGDKDAIDAVAAGDWTKLYGFVGDEALSGSFDRRYNIGQDNSFHVDGAAKQYRFQVNMANLTYTITPLNFSEYIYEAGTNNDWGGVEQPLYCPDGNGIYVGFFWGEAADWADGKAAFKFQGEFNTWDKGNYGTGTMTDDFSGTLIDDGGSGNILTQPGFLRAEVDLAAMTYKITPITTIGIIGPAQAGGWDTDTDMTYNPTTRAWEATIELAADELKFRANDGWDINWGGTNDNLVQNGANLKMAEAGTYLVQFFPLCETKSHVVFTKQ